MYTPWFTWVSHGSHGYLLVHMGISWFTWVYLSSHGYLSVHMGISWFTWVSLGSHGYLHMTEYCHIPLHGSSTTIMLPHAIQHLSLDYNSGFTWLMSTLLEHQW